jgi:hypothetical protein
MLVSGSDHKAQVSMLYLTGLAVTLCTAVAVMLAWSLGYKRGMSVHRQIVDQALSNHYDEIAKELVLERVQEEVERVVQQRKWRNGL